MEFYQWIRYLIATICAVFQATPEEIGFESFKGGGGGGGNTFESKNEQRIVHSQDKGLYPLMLWLEELITTEIVQKIYPDLAFSWIGLRDKTEQERVDIATKELAAYKTMNEVRAENDLPKIDKPWADVPMNPTLPQMIMTVGQGDEGQDGGEQDQGQEQGREQAFDYGDGEQEQNGQQGQDGQQEEEDGNDPDEEYYRQLMNKINAVGKKTEKSWMADLEKSLEALCV